MKTHRIRGCLQPCKKGAIDIKNTRMRKKVFFYENFLDFELFSYFFFGFPQGFISCDLISCDFIDSPQTILGKKSQESKTQDFISSDIFSKDQRKFGLFLLSFYFQVFFQNLFSRDFLTQIRATSLNLFTKKGSCSLNV